MFPYCHGAVPVLQKGRTAIERAVFYGRAEACTMLISRGCDLKGRDEVGAERFARAASPKRLPPPPPPHLLSHSMAKRC